jgi:hypothetical protein
VGITLIVIMDDGGNLFAICGLEACSFLVNVKPTILYCCSETNGLVNSVISIVCSSVPAA